MKFRLFDVAIYVLRLSIVIYFLASTETRAERSAATNVRITYRSDSTDEFSVINGNGKVMCAMEEEGEHACSKYDAMPVKSIGICPENQEMLRCQCNSAKPTFLVHQQKCVKDGGFIRLTLRERNSTGCKFRITRVDGDADHQCLKSTIPTLSLSANISHAQRYSLCTPHAKNAVDDCKLEGNELFYLNKEGRWRRIWKLQPREEPIDFEDMKLDYVLRKLSSAAPRYNGLIVKLQATCRLIRVRGLRLRGQIPLRESKSCVLFKIAGSRSWSIEPKQINLTQPNTVNTNFTNHTSHQLQRHHNMEPAIINTTSGLPVTLRRSTTSYFTDEPITEGVEIQRVKTAHDRPSNKLLIAVVTALVFLLLLVLVCLVVVLKWRRRRTGRTKQRRRSTGNPTYERGPDNSLALTTMTAAHHPETTPPEMPPYAHVYQPLVENTRPHFENGELYESLESVRETPLTRCFSDLTYQDLIRMKNRNACLNRTYQKLLVTSVATSPVSSRSLQRSQSETSFDTAASAPHAQSSFDVIFLKQLGICNDWDQSDDEERSQSELGEELDGLIAICQSNSLSSSFHEKEAVVGFEHESNLWILPFHGEISINDELLQEEDCVQGIEGSLENSQDVTVASKLCDSTESEHTQIPHPASDVPSPPETDTTHDALHNGSVAYRLSGLEIDILSECESETSRESNDSTSDQSELLYHVLEGPYSTC